jgi:signal transduction histidine kinase
MTNLDADRHFLAGLTLLVVEDDGAAREQLSTFLKRRVRVLSVAETAELALRSVEAMLPDLVMTDLRLPGMDGLAMAQTLRSQYPTLPIIVVTAFERSDYLRRAIDIGVDRFVMKPIDPEQLDAALLHCARRLRAEEELAAQKRREHEMERARHDQAMGLLAAGMARDFGNKVQAIMDAIASAIRTSREGGNPVPILNLAEASFGEVQSLRGRLDMLYSNHGDRQPVELRRLVSGVVRTVLAGTTCQPMIEFCPNMLPVLGNGDQLAQVFDALVRNALEAMPDGGTLSVVGNSTTIADGTALGLKPGQYMKLTFTDQGSGIPADVLPRVFEPYGGKTDKGRTSGEGLSLAIARAIVHMHDGIIEAASVPGEGATLTVYLPTVAD